MIGEHFQRAIVLGFGRPLLLWLLQVKPSSGYELMSEIERLTGVMIGPGLIYPFLRMLERGDYVAGRWIEKAGRRVKYYSITKKGEALLENVKALFKLPIREVLLDLLD